MGPMYLLVAHLLQCRSSLCLHPVRGLLLSCFYIASLWLRQFFKEVVGEKYLLHLLFLSKALEKSTNNSVTSRFLARTPSRIRRIVKIYDVMDRFL